MLAPRLAAAQFACTELLAFSQTLQWAVTPEFERLIDDDRWQIRFRAGGDVDVWANPWSDAWRAPVREECLGSGSPVLCSPCRQYSSAPDRVILTITLDHYEGDLFVWVRKIRAAVATIRQMHPSARRIVLQPVVGGPNHTVCPHPDQRRGVRASYHHPIIDFTSLVVLEDSPLLALGPSPEVDSCRDYSDSAGHLVPGARPEVGFEVGAFYALDGRVTTTTTLRDDGGGCRTLGQTCDGHSPCCGDLVCRLYACREP